MKRFVYVFFAACVVCASLCEGAYGGTHNRRNRGGRRMQEAGCFRQLETVKDSSSKAVEKPREKTEAAAAPLIHMPAAFDPSVVDMPKDRKEKARAAKVAKTVSKDELKEEIQRQAKVKRVKVCPNDPAKCGVDVEAFCESLSDESRRVFDQMDSQGKTLAQLLFASYEDPNLAVRDAALEMERRDLAINKRGRHRGRKRSVYE